MADPVDQPARIWQADFYRRPLQDGSGQALWELIVCDPTGTFATRAFCPQTAATAAWVSQMLQTFASPAQPLPQILQVFRPQSLNLLEAACQPLSITIEPTRHTPALKQLILETDYSSLPESRPASPNSAQSQSLIALEKPPPLPLPDHLWGDRWQFAALTAADLIPTFQSRAIPIRDMPPSHFPIALNLPSDLPIPGVVIQAGRRSMLLARWLQQVKPYALSALSGDPNGLILEAGLVDRWVLTTFDDADVITAARSFQTRQQAAKGLHFLLVQPDDSGMTFSGFWLLVQ